MAFRGLVCSISKIDCIPPKHLNCSVEEQVNYNKNPTQKTSHATCQLPSEIHLLRLLQNRSPLV